MFKSFDSELARKLDRNPNPPPCPKTPGCSPSVISLKHLNIQKQQTPPKIPYTNSLTAVKMAVLKQQENENLDGSFPALFILVNSV